MMFPFHFESKVEVNASADAVFLFLDDPKRLSAHMSKSSWMMAGSRMLIELDAAEGRSVGSTIRLSGGMLSISIGVEEAVTERTPPLRKVWETKGAPRLLVIGHYRMGYVRSRLKVIPRHFGSLSTMLSPIRCLRVGSVKCSAPFTLVGVQIV
jgi:hypothetical protein